MANKLTKEKLDSLIEQVLKEVSVSVKQDLADIEKDLDVPDGTSNLAKYKDLADTVDDDDVLDDKDFKKAYNYSPRARGKYAKRKSLANKIYNKTTNKGSFPTPPGGSGGGGKTEAQLYAAYSIEKKSGVNKYKDAIIQAVNKNELSDANDLLALMKKNKYKRTPGATSAYAKAAEAIANASIASTGSEQYFKALKNLQTALSVIDDDEMPISRPTVYSQPGSAGKFGEEIISSFNTVFGFRPPANTLRDRVLRISEISVAMTQQKEDAVDDISFIKSITDANEKKRAILSCMMVLDYIAAFAKYFDHGSGAYMFETFCALISGGQVKGKDMDSGDFTIATPSGELKGSSKYIQYGKKSTQAISGFEDGSTTTYIVGGKSSSVSGTAKTSDPNKLVKVSISLGDVKVENGDVASSSGELKFTKKGSDIEIEPIKTTADILLAKNKGKTFRASLEKTMDKQSSNTKDAFEKFKEFMKASLQVDVITKKYIDTGEKTDGNAALKATESLDKMQVNLINDIRGAGQQEVDKIGSGERELEENKKNKTKSIKDLDKLIERVILNKMNK